MLAFLVDIPPAALGFRAEARLWLSVQPSQITTVVTERIAALDAIRAIETAPVIRTVKRAGTLLLP
ncbi:hypothetical protein ADK86_12865 [Streptomyces sp. NRRL F-5755]|uniref:hypothetical protein n=1 Tax=Streptomyces sp. NRRL F-5755 TaxID=1519475 RepID=UPI0006ADA112|nr:hypothetical protein [Streptomyces sp. NRRL F-5755]KOU01198.1 hypothetical protein ADK86_12865 [Streptomyces sp. NRRL F-5755]